MSKHADFNNVGRCSIVRYGIYLNNVVRYSILRYVYNIYVWNMQYIYMYVWYSTIWTRGVVWSDLCISLSIHSVLCGHHIFWKKTCWYVSESSGHRLIIFSFPSFFLLLPPHPPCHTTLLAVSAWHVYVQLVTCCWGVEVWDYWLQPCFYGSCLCNAFSKEVKVGRVALSRTPTASFWLPVPEIAEVSRTWMTTKHGVNDLSDWLQYDITFTE